jgi:hypothetical protein
MRSSLGPLTSPSEPLPIRGGLKMEPILMAHFLHRQDSWHTGDIRPMMAVTLMLPRHQETSQQTGDLGHLEPQLAGSDELTNIRSYQNQEN